MVQSSKGYVTARLQDCLIDIPQYGANASATDYDPRLPRYIRITDITDLGTLSNSDLKSINEKDAIGYILEPGDFLFARSGATVGKTYLHKVSSNRMAYAGYLIRFRIDKSKLMPEFLEQYTKTSDYWAWVRKTIHSGAQPNINANEYVSMEIPLPPLNQQNKIIEMLSIWDLAIDKIVKLIEVKENLYRGLCQKLLTFKGLRQIGQFEQLQASTLFASVSNHNHSHSPLLAVTQDNGVVRRDSLEGRVMMPSGEVSNYKLVEPGDFVISLRSFQGGVEYSNIQGLVSPAYTILRPKLEISRAFYKHYFKSYDFIGRLAIAVIGIRDGKQISYQDFSSLKIPYPPLEVQNHIAKILDLALVNIEMSKRYLNLLSKQKHGLMQKLLTGDWRVKTSTEEE